MSQARYIKVATVEQALAEAASNQNNYVYLAGGTDLQPNRQQRLVREQTVIDLLEIPKLNGITKAGSSISIGSMTSLQQLIDSDDICQYLPMLAEAASVIATPVIRMTATAGGNLLCSDRCRYYNQTAEWRTAIGSCLRDVGEICQVTQGKTECFARNVSDLAPALIALEATVSIRNQNDRLEFSLDQLYKSDGIINHQHLESDAIIEQIDVPIKSTKTWFRKLRLRESIDFSSLTIAAALDSERRLRIGIGAMSMAPVMIDVTLSETSLDDLIVRARRKCKTVDNDHLPLKYRRDMLEVYLRQMWAALVS